MRSLIVLMIAAALPCCAQPSSGEWDRVPLTGLRAGVAEVDITPPIGIALSGYAERKGPSTGVHDPLRVVAAVFDDGNRRAAILAYDLISLTKDDGDEIRRAIQEAAGVGGDHVILNVSHTHGAPALRNDPTYRTEVIRKSALAAKQALGKLRRVSLGYGEGAIDFNINRRTLVDGKAIGRLNPDGVCDRRVKVLRLDDSDAVEPMAVMAHAVCHPNVFRSENTQISADFAGLAMAFASRSFGGKTVPMFLQGCTGDIRSNMPPVAGGWRNGSAADMTWCALSLGAETVKIAAGLRVREKMTARKKQFRIRAGEDVVRLTPDPKKLDRRNREDIVDGKILVSIRAVAIGDYLFVGLPGEPVVEYGLFIEKDLAPWGRTVFVLGYCSGNAGYIPVEHMIDEGGYEAQGPYWYGSERGIREGVKKLVTRLLR